MHRGYNRNSPPMHFRDHRSGPRPYEKSWNISAVFPRPKPESSSTAPSGNSSQYLPKTTKEVVTSNSVTPQLNQNSLFSADANKSFKNNSNDQSLENLKISVDVSNILDIDENVEYVDTRFEEPYDPEKALRGNQFSSKEPSEDDNDEKESLESLSSDSEIEC